MMKKKVAKKRLETKSLSEEIGADEQGINMPSCVMIILNVLCVH